MVTYAEDNLEVCSTLGLLLEFVKDFTEIIENTNLRGILNYFKSANIGF